MFASVMRTTGQASTEQAKRVINQTLPRGQSVPGFKGVLFLLDEKGGKGMAIVFYESEELARASAEARDRLRKEAASESWPLAWPSSSRRNGRSTQSADRRTPLTGWIPRLRASAASSERESIPSLAKMWSR